MEAHIPPLGDIPWSHEPALVVTLKVFEFEVDHQAVCLLQAQFTETYIYLKNELNMVCLSPFFYLTAAVKKYLMSIFFLS